MKPMKLFTFFITLFISISLFAGESKNDDKGTELKRFAVIVGANNGGKARVKLFYARKDARSISRVLAKLGGIHPSNTTLLLDPAADDIRSTFSSLKEKVATEKSSGKTTQVLFYYSGHSDEEGLLLGEEHLRYRELRNELNNLGSDVKIAILDSCASGAMTRGKGGNWQAPFLVDNSSLVKGHAFLTSASATEAAQESDRLGGSFFTHYMISGLRGAADASGDKRVTLNEAYQYAFHETLKRTQSTVAGPQHPSYDFQLAGAGDLVLTDLRATSSLLIFPKNLSGRFFIRDEAGTLIAEINKLPGRDLQFGLEEGTYSVTFEATAGTIRSGSISLESGKALILDVSEFDEGNRDKASVSKGADGEKRYNSMPVSLGIFPAWSMNKIVEKPVLNNFAMHLIMSDGAALEGFEFSGLGSTRTDYVKGIQLSGFWNSVDGDMYGAQLSGFFNHTEKEMKGLQLTGFFNNSSGHMNGLQAAGILNVSQGESTGGQLGIVNIAAKEFTGVQAGNVNITWGDFTGLQLGVTNIIGGDFAGVELGDLNVVLGNFEGIQMGVANVTTGEKFAGLQLGAANYTHGKVDGIQIGIVNIADDSDFSLGLINIMKKGRTHIGLYGDDEGSINVELKHGGKYWHSIYFGGIIARETPFYKLGIGLGGHIPLTESVFMDIDLLSFSTVSKEHGFDENKQTATIRLLGGYRLNRWISLTAAATLNTSHQPVGREHHSFIDGWEVKEGDPDADTEDTEGHEMRLWPGFQLGAQFL